MKPRHRTDANQGQIIAEGELLGAQFRRIDRPLDLVGVYAGVTFLCECVGEGKRRNNPPDGLSDSQRAFIREWPGLVCVAYKPLDLIEFLHTLPAKAPPAIWKGQPVLRRR